jgi:hypothetical protein
VSKTTGKTVLLAILELLAWQGSILWYNRVKMTLLASK